MFSQNTVYETEYEGYTIQCFEKAEALIDSNWGIVSPRGKFLTIGRNNSVRIGAKVQTYAHRIMCKTWHKQPEGYNEVTVRSEKGLLNPRTVFWVKHCQTQFKLTIAERLDIYEAYWEGGKSQPFLARKYNVSNTMIANIVNRNHKTWKAKRN